MNPEERGRRRMDEHGFPQDTYQGRHQYMEFEGLHVGWYPMIQLLHTTNVIIRILEPKSSDLTRTVF
jgi:hypothetical protein